MTSHASGSPASVERIYGMLTRPRLPADAAVAYAAHKNTWNWGERRNETQCVGRFVDGPCASLARTSPVRAAGARRGAATGPAALQSILRGLPRQAADHQRAVRSVAVERF